MMRAMTACGCWAIAATLTLPGAARSAAEAPLEVFVSIPPLAYMVERVGGEHVVVRVLLGPGQTPHTFEPTPRQAAALSGADLYLTVGLPFEARLAEQIEGAHRKLRVVDVAEGITKQAAEGHREAHPEGTEPTHAPEPDPHVWLTPAQIKTLSTHAAEALAAADPAHAAQYTHNLSALLSEVDAVDARIRKRLAPLSGRTFYVFHPAFGYFADAYGLKQQAVEVEGKSPTPKQLAALLHGAKAAKVKTLFVQPQFEPHSAAAVASALGAAIVPLDPLARDVLANLEHIAAQIEEALAEPEE